MVNDRGYIGGPPELRSLQGRVVGLHHSLDACTVGVLGVAVQSKLMGHLGGREGGGREGERAGSHQIWCTRSWKESSVP